MSTRQLTPNQSKCVDQIMGHIKEYLTFRSFMTIRANPRFHDIWPGLQWSILTQLRNTLENDKMWGPERHVVGEVFCSDEYGKIRDLFNPTNQRSIQVEVVEKKDDAKHTTADVLEIHDFRTLYAAIDPAVATVTNVMQIYIWWDLPDATDLSRFEMKAERLRSLLKGVPDRALEFYSRIIKKEEEGQHITAEDVVIYELQQLQYIRERFDARRALEPGFQVIAAQRPKASSPESDSLMTAMARELLVLNQVREGKPLDETMTKKFAEAMHVAPEELTAESEQQYLEKMIAEQKRRLRTLLDEEVEGEYYNVKIEQSERMARVYEQLRGDREVPHLSRSQMEPVGNA